MPRRKKASSESETGGILAFLSGEREQEEKRTGRSGETPTSTAVAGLEAEVLSLIRASGAITKSKLWSWAKRRGIRPVDLYRALQSLQAKGLVKKGFDAQSEELVYKLA